jgi:succinate dehydrogenase / fumarate reductase membrane anchor subunit
MSETKLKLIQYITGIGLFFFVGVHLIVSHLGSGDAAEWESVSGRAESAGWLALYLLLILFGLYHGIHGLRTVVIEAIPRLPSKLVDGVLIFTGVAIFIYAVYIPVDAFLV